jgi:glycosyltransferase involved in cell wall biosynthesis
MPAVSIVMPTFNRLDTVGRAIASIREQSFQDWELVVVDDGSTDGTAEAIGGLDDRIRVIRQPNQGCYVARNTGLHETSGRFITFMDSDDEWRPFFLELTAGFLTASPGDHVVTTEFLEETGGGEPVRHDVYDVTVKFPRMAATVGSRLMDLPPGETDDYLRVYATREPLGDWAGDVAVRAGYPDAGLYRGQIFEHLRFGYLGWLPTTVLTREALATVGEFLPGYRAAADFRFLGLLFKNYRANMISVPAAIKHTTAVGGRALTEGHLATGANEYRFAANRLPLYDELFFRGRESDPELRRVRGQHHLHAGRVAAECGKRREALQHLTDALADDPQLSSARVLRALIRLAPTDAWLGRAYGLSRDVQATARRLGSGQLSPGDLLRKVAQRVTSRI